MTKTPKFTCRRLSFASAVALAAGLVYSNPHLSRGEDKPSAAVTTTTVSAITKPSQESKLSFAGPGLVVDVAVKDGDFVKKGQILASQDTREDEFAYQSMKLEAESSDKIDYSKADSALKRTQLERKEKMLKENVASPSEVEEAQNAVNLSVAQIALAVLEHQQKSFDAQKQAVKIEQMHRIAPFDGVIEMVNVHPGEMADPQNKDGAIVIGHWDPLWVEMHLPTNQSSQLKVDQTLDTKYEDETDWKPAKISLLGNVDAASDTQLVRMVLPNPDNARHPGLHLQVRLPEKLVASVTTP